MMNMINMSLQISTYMNYCIFQTSSQKVAQKIQFFNIQKSKIFKSGFSKTWRENKKNIVDIMIEIILFLTFKIITKRVLEYL